MDNCCPKDVARMEKPTFEELRLRLERVRSKDDYDERDACCWQGYLAALLEWDLITPSDHRRLSTLVPVSGRDPSEAIFLG